MFATETLHSRNLKILLLHRERGFIRKGTNAAFSIWNNGLGLKVKYFRVLCVSVAYCFFTMICRCAWWEGFIATRICRRVWWEGFIVIYRI